MFGISMQENSRGDTMIIGLQFFGGRGAGSGLPESNPQPGGGGGGNPQPLDQFPGAPDTLAEALGQRGRPMSVDRAVGGANPFYDRTMSTAEYNENCQRAVVATEARFRGYNVIAQPTYDQDTMPHGNEWMRSFKGATREDVGRTTPRATQRALESQMKSYGDGARAVMQVEWKGANFGHVLNVVQRNGRTYYYDGQNGTRVNANSLFNAIRTRRTGLVRVDNLDFGDRAREAVRQTPKGI